MQIIFTKGYFKFMFNGLWMLRGLWWGTILVHFGGFFGIYIISIIEHKIWLDYIFLTLCISWIIGYWYAVSLAYRRYLKQIEFDKTGIWHE